MFLWLILAYSMQAPLAVKTKMYSMDESGGDITNETADALKVKLANLTGVVEAVVLPQERTVILKIDKSHNWDEAQLEVLVHKLLRG